MKDAKIQFYPSCNLKTFFMLKSFLSKVLLKIAPKSKPLLINDLQSIDLRKGKDFNVSLTLASA